jgi:hypothetical protein
MKTIIAAFLSLVPCFVMASESQGKWTKVEAAITYCDSAVYADAKATYLVRANGLEIFKLRNLTVDAATQLRNVCNAAHAQAMLTNIIDKRFLYVNLETCEVLPEDGFFIHSQDMR